MPSQAKAWAFTSFTYNNESFRLLCEKAANESVLFVVQEETSPSTGRNHLQGFVRFKANYRLARLKTWLSDVTAHCEVAKGTSQHNYEYCTKADSATG